MKGLSKAEFVWQEEALTGSEVLGRGLGAATLSESLTIHCHIRLVSDQAVVSEELLSERCWGGREWR